MRGLLTNIWADRITRVATVLSIGMIAVTVAYILFVYQNLPPFLPLYNQLGWGEPRLGDKPFIFLLPPLTLLVFIGNTVFASFLYATMPLVARILAITSLLVTALMLIFVFRMTQLLL